MSKRGSGPLPLAGWSGTPSKMASLQVAGLQATAGIHVTLLIPSTHWGQACCPWFDPLQAALASIAPITVSAMSSAVGCSESQRIGLLTSTGLSSCLQVLVGDLQLCGLLEVSSPTSCEREASSGSSILPPYCGLHCLTLSIVRKGNFSSILLR